MEKNVGPYQLGEPLGTLPFGELVAAIHPARSEPLAVLLLDDRLAKDHRFRGLIRLEIARAGGIRHPALARAVEVGEHAGALYVVFERPADTQTLERVLAEGDPPSREDAAALVRALAAALDAAHGRRLIHGALAPTTVLVGPDCHASIVGVGLNGAVEEAGLAAVVAEQTEAAFTAPEQRDGGRAVAASDGYALGRLAAALLRVQPPPAGPADAVGNVLARQYAADPAARFPTCTAFVMALAETLLPSSMATAVAAPVPGTPPVPPAVAPASIASAEPRTESPTFQAASTRHSAPEPAPPLPWDAPAAAPAQAPMADPGSAQESKLPTEPWRTPSPARSAHAVTTVDLTPAMADLLKPPLPNDPIGDGIRWASDRFPSVDAFLDRTWPDGKVGPLPLGIAATAALAVLFVVFGQAWPATVVIMIVVVLYGVPRAASVLSSGERTTPRAVRVTGTTQLKRTPDAIGAGIPKLELPNGETLSLRAQEYEALKPLGRPVTIPWSAHGASGGTIEVGHELPGATVTYISPNKMLVDVRTPEGAVIVRRSPYLGEPGDQLWTSADHPPPGLPTTDGTVWGAARSTGDVSPGAPPLPAPGQLHAPTQSIVLLIPPAAMAALKRGAERQKVLAITLAVFGLFGVGLLWGMMGAFSLFYLLFGIPVAVGVGWAHFAPAFKIAGASAPMSMVRIVGPVIVSKYRANKRYRCFVQFADGTRFRIDQGLCQTLESAGEVRIEESWVFNFDESRRTPDGFIQAEHVITAATSVFEPTTERLLEIRNPFGGTVYRDADLKDGDLGSYQSTI